MNVEAYKVCEGTLASQGGVLADDEGKVRAFWMSFSIENERKEQSSIMGGLPSQFVIDILNSIISEKKAVLRALDVEFWQVQLANARILGLSDDWIAKLKSKSTEKQIGAVYILGITDLSSPSGQLIKPGDIVLQINGKLPTRIADIDQYVNEKEILDMVRVGGCD
jgi:S1-C subfamily serine protease